MYDMMKRFAVSVDCGGITAAAKKLFVSQPAVTKSLKQLEEYYGVELLIRGRKGVVPTEYGKIVYRLAKLMEKSIEDVEEEIGIKKSKAGNRLSIGAGLLWSYLYLPDALNSFVERMPEVNIDISLSPPLELHKKVCDGRLDMAIGEMPEERLSGVVYEDLLVSKSSIFAHHSHPLRSKPKITQHDLRHCHWIEFSSKEEETVTASHDPSDYNVTKMANLLLACLVLQKGNHVMRLPVALAPIMEKFDIGSIQHKPSETEFVSGLFYRESGLIRSTSLQMIKEIRRLRLD